jgi:tetratricopeptide (TPR) repeat protein
MDLRGLAAIMGRIDALLAATHRADQDVDSLDLFGLSRFLQKRGEPDRAHAACSQALDLGLPIEFRPQARRELALLAKRRGDHAAAALLWHELATEITDNVLDAIHACEQLALYYERRVKDFPRALEFARLALSKVTRLRGSSRDPYAAARIARMEQQCLNRVTRLQHRISFAQGVRPALPLLDPRRVAPAASRRVSNVTLSRKLGF